MYSKDSNAHRIVHDLVNHPQTVRRVTKSEYVPANGKWQPAEARVVFDDGTSLSFHDEVSGGVLMSSYRGEYVDNMQRYDRPNEEFVSKDTWYNSILDDATVTVTALREKAKEGNNGSGEPHWKSRRFDEVAMRERFHALEENTPSTVSTSSDVPTPSPSKPSTKTPSGKNWSVPGKGRYLVNGEDGKPAAYQVKAGPTSGSKAIYPIDLDTGKSGSTPIRSPRLVEGVVDSINADPEKAMRDFGTFTGKCGRCGRVLSDARSQSIGLGPSCRTR